MFSKKALSSQNENYPVGNQIFCISKNKWVKNQSTLFS